MVAVLAMGLIVVGTPAAHAVSCSGDRCSGQDPQATGCSVGGYTVASKSFPNGILEIRWSPTCKTNWARMTVYPIGWKILTPIPIQLAAIQDTGYVEWKSYSAGSGEGTFWTNMIYSPVRRVKARVTLSCQSAGDCAVSALTGQMVYETIYV